MSKRNPLPWRIAPRDSNACIEGEHVAILDATGRVVADNEEYYPAAVNPDTQREIVRAVNTNADLLAALRALLEAPDLNECATSERGIELCDDARLAIDKATRS